jgi:YegS/Rv2252/BmrU family lipid kinase
MKNLFLIANPASGTGKIKTQLFNVVNILSSQYRVTVYITGKKGDATREAANLDDTFSTIVVCGGDGTLNEVINAAADFANAEVAVVPVGTGNDFVKNFTNAKHFMNMKRQILGTPVKIDLIKFNGRYCANVLNIGFDCSVVQKMGQFRRNKFVPNKMAYVAGIVAALANEYGVKFRLTIDDEETRDEEFLLAAFGKGSFYGGGFKALPLSIPNDGYIDACVAAKISRMSFIKCVGKYKEGNHLDLDFISYKKCRKIHIESDEPIGVCADGEVTMETIIDVEVLPGALTFSAPDGCELAAISHETAPEEEITVDSNKNEEAAI